MSPRSASMVDTATHEQESSTGRHAGAAIIAAVVSLMATAALIGVVDAATTLSLLGVACGVIHGWHRTRGGRD